jgi:hypothetical protein
MPSKRPDASRERPDMMLRIGKYNNFVAWLEIMKTDAGALYGATARGFSQPITAMFPAAQQRLITTLYYPRFICILGYRISITLHSQTSSHPNILLSLYRTGRIRDLDYLMVRSSAIHYALWAGRQKMEGREKLVSVTRGRRDRNLFC